MATVSLRMWATALALVMLPSFAHAHGRMLDPASRMSAYLLGFSTPVNYNDIEMNCGGRVIQWQQNGGKCGICGDVWSGPRYYERPNGTMVQHNVITKVYREGDVISIKLQITANHMGWNEYRICDIARSGGIEATHECLDQNLLADESGRTRFYFENTNTGFYTHTLVLPAGFTCAHCLLQWKWHCGNDWGCDSSGCALGKGEVQEEFYACSDVTITSRNGSVVEASTPSTTEATRPTTQTPTTQAPTTQDPTTTTTTTIIPSSSFIPLPVTTPGPAGTTTTTSTTTITSATTSTTSPTTSPTIPTSQPSFPATQKPDAKLPFATVSPINTNLISGDDFLKMILGQKSNYTSIVGGPTLPPPTSSIKYPTASSGVYDALTRDRLCATCTIGCRFQQCYTYCPQICSFLDIKRTG